MFILVTSAACAVEVIDPFIFFQSAIESLFGASMTGIAYSLFGGQPLTILGSTGPVLVFEKILFKFCK
jgi:sodium bicarbonate cotransporter 5